VTERPVEVPPWRERARLMFTAKQYRAKAAEYTELLKATSLPAEIREFRRLERSCLTLAENEEWMADNREKMNRPGADENWYGDAILAQQGKHTLGCPGADVATQSAATVPWAACCKQRRYGDRSPASYTSIRSTTFRESLPALLTRNAFEAISQPVSR
jgi:hypothetical protein